MLIRPASPVFTAQSLVKDKQGNIIETIPGTLWPFLETKANCKIIRVQGTPKWWLSTSGRTRLGRGGAEQASRAPSRRRSQRRSRGRARSGGDWPGRWVGGEISMPTRGMAGRERLY